MEAARRGRSPFGPAGSAVGGSPIEHVATREKPPSKKGGHAGEPMCTLAVASCGQGGNGRLEADRYTVECAGTCRV